MNLTKTFIFSMLFIAASLPAMMRQDKSTMSDIKQEILAFQNKNCNSTIKDQKEARCPLSDALQAVSIIYANNDTQFRLEWPSKNGYVMRFHDATTKKTLEAFYAYGQTSK